jgi:hypothetical protein
VEKESEMSNLGYVYGIKEIQISVDKAKEVLCVNTRPELFEHYSIQDIIRLLSE